MINYDNFFAAVHELDKLLQEKKNQPRWMMSHTAYMTLYLHKRYMLKHYPAARKYGRFGR